MTGPHYVHPSIGFRIDLPPGSVVADSVPDVALVAMEPEDGQTAFRANLTVTVEAVEPGSDIEDYTDASLHVQAETLDAFNLIDRAHANLAGGTGTRTLGHHNVNGQAVTVEQWRLLTTKHGYTVTASCWTLDYHAVAESFAASAQTLSPGRAAW